MEGIKNEDVLIDELKQIHRALLEADETTEDFPNSTRIVEKVNDLRKKYPDYANYSLYHLLSGSTPREPFPQNFDFPGDDSVEKFIRSL